MLVAPSSWVLAAARWRTFSSAAARTRVSGTAPLGAAPRAAATDVPVCIAALSLWSAVAFLGAMDAVEMKTLELECSGKKELFGGRVQRCNGRSNGRGLRAQA